MSDRLRDLGGAVLRSMREAVRESDIRLQDARDEEREKVEEVIGSAKVGIRERYEVALRILEDANVSEGDLVDVARQAHPLAALRRLRGIGPAGGRM